MTLAELNGRLEHLQKEWVGVYEAGKSKGYKQEDLDKLEQMRKEMDDLGAERDRLMKAEDYAAEIKRQQQITVTPVNPVVHQVGEAKSEGDSVEPVTLGQLFTSSQAYKGLVSSDNLNPDAMHPTSVKGRMFDAGAPDAMRELKSKGMKAVVMTGVSLPRAQRVGLKVEASYQLPTVADLIPQTMTDQMTINYLVEGTNTNAAAPTAEGGAAPESSIGAFTEVNEAVRWIPNGIPVTEQTLRSEPMMRGFIDNRLQLFVQLTEEAQLLSGNGTAPNLTGILNRAGIQTQAKGTDPTFDAVYRAMTLVRNANRTARLQPSGVVMHPNDWQDIRLTRSTDGVYIYGNPNDNEQAARLWGVPVVETSSIAENTALVGAFRQASEIFRYWELGVTVFSEHSDFAARRMLYVRADTALALAVYYPAGFATVTGI